MSQTDAAILAAGYEELGYESMLHDINSLMEEGYTPEEAFKLHGIDY